MKSNLNHVLNLVRHEADRNPTFDDPFPMTQERALDLIKSAALLVRRACLASPELLTMLSDQATVCQSREDIGTFCGDVQEHRACAG